MSNDLLFILGVSIVSFLAPFGIAYIMMIEDIDLGADQKRAAAKADRSLHYSKKKGDS